MAIFIDAHVHIYPEFNREEFFRAAFDNFLSVSKREKLSEDASYVLALAESRDSDVFSDLYESAAPFGSIAEKQTDPNSISFYKTEESDSLLVCMGEHTISLLAGRQLVSKENIEVISLLSLAKHKDKELPLDALLKAVAGSGGIVVIPWGVGKWLGGRGELVTKCVETHYDFPVYIGDNGNRPSFWPAPSLFRTACEENSFLLSGSDPLPLASHCTRVATSGTLLAKGEISENHPAESLRKQLIQSKDKREFGARLNPIRFFRDQLRMNLLNRF